jgi:hypothetical protein
LVLAIVVMGTTTDVTAVSVNEDAIVDTASIINHFTRDIQFSKPNK